MNLVHILAAAALLSLTAAAARAESHDCEAAAITETLEDDCPPTGLDGGLSVQAAAAGGVVLVLLVTALGDDSGSTTTTTP